MKNKKVPRPYMKNLMCLLKKGSLGTGSQQREIPMALLFVIQSS